MHRDFCYCSLLSAIFYKSRLSRVSFTIKFYHGHRQGTKAVILIYLYFHMCTVVHRTVDLNFSIEVSTFTNSCFSVAFSWVQPSDMQVILETVLNNVTVTAMNYSIQYTSPSPRCQNRTIMLSTNISEYELSAEEMLMPSTNYSFWLHVDVDLSNGTYGHLESFRLDAVTPSCSGRVSCLMQIMPCTEF